MILTLEQLNTPDGANDSFANTEGTTSCCLNTSFCSVVLDTAVALGTLAWTVKLGPLSADTASLSCFPFSSGHEQIFIVMERFRARLMLESIFK